MIRHNIKINFILLKVDTLKYCNTLKVKIGINAY